MSKKIEGMKDMKKQILSYLQGKKKVYEDALKQIDTTITDSDPEVRKLREYEAQRLRDRIYEITHHIDVITLIV